MLPQGGLALLLELLDVVNKASVAVDLELLLILGLLKVLLAEVVLLVNCLAQSGEPCETGGGVLP